MPTNFNRLDAAENIFFERQLEQVKAQSYDVKYPDMLGRTLVPVDNTVDPGAETVKFDIYDRVGVAKIISSYADDLPRSDVKATEVRQAIKSIGSSFGYSIQEIRAAKMAGKPLEQRKANAARLAVEKLVDDLIFKGDSTNGLVGLNNVTNAQTFTPVTKAVPGGSTVWTATTTGLEMLADMNGTVNAVTEGTNGVETADTLLMPIAQYDRAASTPLQAGSDTTVLKHFLANNPYIKSVQPWYRLKQAGTASKDRMIAYKRDPQILQVVIPQEFEMFAPEQENLAFKIACHARIGGILPYYPMSICYCDGV